MLKNYLKIAWRNLQKNKLFSLLNIFGLSLSLCIFLLLSLFIIQERSFDDLPHQDKIFRYLAHLDYDGNKMDFGTVPNAVGPAIQTSFPEIRYSARALLNDFGQNANINVGADTYIESRLYWADPDIVNIFGIQLINGDPQSALQAPNTVLLSESKARQYFGNEDPVNKTIDINRSQTLTVAGVFKDLPKTLTFDADMIASYSSTGFHRRGDTWDNASFETWIMLDKAENASRIKQSLSKILDQHVEPANQYFSLSLQALGDVHLNSAGIQAYSKRLGDGSQLRQLSYLAIALLLMAAINYMNLATARAQQRAKEVGVNKTLGAKRSSLIARFYTETFLLAGISILLGCVLSLIGIPLFNRLSGKELEYSSLLNPLFLMGLPVLWVAISLLSGIYPALILSSFNPLQALQKGREQRVGSILLRKSLVVLQFSASIILIVSILVMYRQMNFVRQQKLGYNPENVMAIGLSSIKSDEEFDYLRNNITSLANVEEVSQAQAIPGKGESGHYLHKDSEDQGMWLSSNRIIGDVGDVLQLNLIAGSTLLERKQPRDSLNRVVLNKYAVDYLGLTPEDAIGQKVNFGIPNCYISGVVENFNFLSLHNPMGAYAFTNAPESIRFLMVRFKTGDLHQSIAQFEAAFKKSVANAPFDYQLLDSHLDQLYRADRQTASIILSFSLFAVLIGCLGLFGLAAFTAEKRVKEIGVRKVLGASVQSIVSLLSIDYVRLVSIAFLIACPIAFWLANKWLENFAYHIELSWWIFAAAGLAAIAIALLTVSFQAIKAALANPVTSLRNE